MGFLFSEQKRSSYDTDSQTSPPLARRRCSLDRTGIGNSCAPGRDQESSLVGKEINMATAAIPQPRFASFPQRIFEPLPGVALLAAIGLLGKFIEQRIALYGKSHHLHLPNIEYVLWAILIGVVVANSVGVPKVFRAGIATYDFWLKTGIVLLGARFLVGDLALMGGVSLALVVIELSLAISFMTWLGRAFGLNRNLSALFAVGSSVCGVSAIIATQGAIEADDED